MKLSKFKIIFQITILLFISRAQAQNYSLESPDGTIVIDVSVNKNITYSLTVDNQQLMNSSEIALTIDDNIVLGSDPKVIGEKRRHIDQILIPEVKVKNDRIRDNFNELSLTFKGKFKVVFRAYDDGVAYRFETSFKKDIIVRSETSVFNFSKNNEIYFPREEELFSHNERRYELKFLDSLGKNDLCSLPVLATASDETKLLITESGLLDYPGMWLNGDAGNTLRAVFPHVALQENIIDDRSVRVSKTADYIANTNGTRSFPWRIIAVSKKDSDLITNQLTYQLAEPSKISDVSWIKPGKVAWDWYNFNNIYGVDFKAGVNTDTYKYYIDFASKYGLEYIILDEGWYKLGDVLEVVPEMDVKELINYGNKKNVGIILWVTWSSLNQKLEEALTQFESWGIKGIKVDFMQRDDQWMVSYYERVAKLSAEHKLLVDFHGAYKPSGLRRTYPNVITREGVKGAENNKWSEDVTPEHNLTLPFIRMVAGPMDYTPGAMMNAQQEDFRAIFNRPMSLGTRCHQLAMYVCFESPLQMLCDSPSNYDKEPECMEFLSKVPSVWDETIVLDAKISDKLLIARRNKDEWYIGGMTDWTSRNLQLNLSFLPKNKKFEMTLYQDGTNADRIAIDFKQTKMIVDSNFNQEIKLAKGGGFAAMLIPVQ